MVVAFMCETLNDLFVLNIDSVYILLIIVAKLVELHDIKYCT